MARKKEDKVSRSRQYSEILAGMGREIKDCKVLAFEFPDEGLVRDFHFACVDSDGLLYCIFDGVEKVAQLVIPKEIPDEAFVNMARLFAGIQIAPKM